ncbi:hypothetical protein [Epilithonimonas sp.]|uniref:hypothetical protein n=1 Tax=Epilithonimonas sp. TaxID=2894511 RepID=UPI0028A05088|nr:hypothetical protein [Epilithonimonas sp.]
MQKINTINQYLLERFPNIWNTRIVWMLLLGIAVHLIFFFIGFVSHASPGTLQHTRAIDDYFSTGLVFVHVIISVLLIVGWLIYMLKNNAFKNFYPNSGKKLFFEFVQYFIIIFVSVTFYFSYMTGFRLFINYKYDDEKMAKKIEIINHSVPFLSQNIEDYTLENRLSPKPFAVFYCETDINEIDKTRSYFVYHDRVYQYFSLYKKTVNQTDERGQFIYPEEEKKNSVPLAYFENSADNKSRTYFFKKQVEDLSAYIKTVAPSYYNYSSVFYDNVNSAVNRRYDTEADNLPTKELLKQKQIEVNDNTIRLITSKDSKALEKLLQDFLRISKEFDIVNNLNVKDWSAMVYHPEKFEVKRFIMLYKPDAGTDYDPNKAPAGRYNGYEEAVAVDSVAYDDNYLDANGKIRKDTISIRDFNPNVDREISPKDYFKRNMTDFYYYTADLNNLLENVDTIKTDDFFSDSVHLFIWISFALAILIFSFRITDLRSLLFSIISAGVIILLVTLFCVFFAFVGGFKNMFFILYTILTVGVIILLIPFITIGKARKIVTSIFMIISMAGFPLFIWLIFGIINEHQVIDCRTKVYTGDNYLSCKGVLDDLGLTTSYIMLIATFVFLYFYTGFVKKWKAMPE